MKILLAEDTRDMNHVLTAALTHEGYDVDSAFDGEEALDFVRDLHAKPHIFFCGSQVLLSVCHAVGKVNCEQQQKGGSPISPQGDVSMRDAKVSVHHFICNHCQQENRQQRSKIEQTHIQPGFQDVPTSLAADAVYSFKHIVPLQSSMKYCSDILHTFRHIRRVDPSVHGGFLSQQSSPAPKHRFDQRV